MRRYIIMLIAAVMCCLLLISCGEDVTDTAATPSLADKSSMDLTFTERDISAAYGDTVRSIEFSGGTVSGGYTVENGAVALTEEGTYILSGVAEDICITVNAPDKKVQLVLDGFSASNKNGCAIYVKDAKKVFITLKDGTQSSLSDGEGYEITDGDTTIDGAVFSRADLTVNGDGALTVSGNYKHGIVSKDDLAIVNASITVSSLSCGINGKDCVKIKDAELDITAGSDGIRSDNDADGSRGFVYVESGKISISAVNDGIQAETALKIADGEFNIKSGNGEAYESGKGIKAVSDIEILGGVFKIDSYDDGIHSNRTVSISGGDIWVRTNDDGIHADLDLSVSDGKILVSKSYEGLEAERILISGGSIDITASDDGLNASGGNDGSGMGGPFGGGDMFASSDAEIIISGGYLIVDASGDGVDSNGSLTVTGGATLVSGPTNSGNGFLDYGGEAKISGGVFIATGSYGMAQSFTEATGQGVIFTLTGTKSADTSIALCDGDGKVLCSFTPAKAYQCAVISAPGISKGNTYTVVCGGEVANADSNGFAQGSQISGGSVVSEIEMDSLLYGSAGGGFGGGMPGGGMPGGGGRPRK